MHDERHGTLSKTGVATGRNGAETGTASRDDFSVLPGGIRVPQLNAAQRLETGSPRRSAWFHAYTVFMAISILALICSGGLVTSNDAGLAVPDWPTSFGYNMFAFPLSRWLAPGGVRLEHSHRLVATAEGMLTIVLALWAWKAEPRRWVRTLAYATLGAGHAAGGLDRNCARMFRPSVLCFDGFHRPRDLPVVGFAG